MWRTGRAWALGVLGLEDSHTADDLDNAYEELRRIWTPHLESDNETARRNGEKELAKIERAKQILSAAEVPKEASGLSRATLAGLIGAAFVVGFGAMYLYRITTRRDPNVVVPRSLLTAAPKARLDAPDVRVSTERLTPVPLTAEEERAVTEHISELAGEDPFSAMSELEAMGERAIPGLTRALYSRNDDVRMNATTILNSIAAGPDDDPLTPEDMYRLRPIFRSAGTVVALERLQDDPVSVVRENVSYILGNIGDPGAYDTLVRMSTDDEPSVRAGVAYSIGKLNTIEGISPLTALLADSESPVRMAAADALSKYKSIEARTALRDRLSEEDDSDVIDTIRHALENSGGESDDGQGV